MTINEQPYERFLYFGAEALTNAELLAVILRTGTEGTSAVSLGEQILQKKGGPDSSLLSLYHLTMDDLLSIKGIGEVKAVRILSLCEISRRLARAQRGKREYFRTPSEIAGYYMEDLRHELQERVILVHLDAKLRRITDEILSVGTADRALLSVREIFRRALAQNASQILLLHNHPTGDPAPSAADLQVTRIIKEAGKMIQIPLADHIVIGDLVYYSMKEHGDL